jgi:hypothetical protein
VHCIKVLIFVALGNHQASGRFVTLGSCRFLDGLVVEESVEVLRISCCERCCAHLTGAVKSNSSGIEVWSGSLVLTG